MISICVLLTVIMKIQSSSVPWQQKTNSDMITGQYKVYAPAGPMTAGDYNYYSPLFYALRSIQTVHYISGQINARTSIFSDPNNSSNRRIEYYFDAQSYSSAHLNTRVRGYIQSPMFNYLTFRYMIILSNSSLFSNYITSNRVQFTFNFSTTNISTVTTSLPAIYTSITSLSVACFLSDMMAAYPIALENINNLIEIGVNTLIINGTVRSEIKVRPFFYNQNTIFRIRYLILVCDRAAIERDLIGYKFYEGKANVVYSASYIRYNRFYPPFDSTKADTTIILGLTHIEFYNNNQPSFQFFYNLHPTYIYFQFSGNFISYTSTLWATAYYSCSGPLYQLNSTDQLCYYDFCQDGQFYNYSTHQCQNCTSSCLTCYSETQCKSCDPSAYRTLSDLQCVPMVGYFQSNTTAAAPCDSSCLTCSQQADNCTSCANNTYLVGQQCLRCSQLIVGCESCNKTSCFSCNASYHWINSSYCNVLCSSDRCHQCDNLNASYCLSCTHQKYRLVDGFCSDICGDEQIGPFQDCDDGNLLTHDGCDDSCQIQPHYTCMSMTHFLGYNYTAYCSYHQAIDLSFITLEKIADSNSLRVVLSLNHSEQQFWQDYQAFSPFVFVNISYQNMEVRLVQEWTFSDHRQLYPVETSIVKVELRAGAYQPGQLAHVTFTYHQQLHLQTLQLRLDFASSRDPRVSTIPSSNTTFLVSPDNNHYAYNYPEQTYNQYSLIKKTLFFVSIAYLVLYTLSLVAGNKRIMAEGIMVAQVTFAGLAACPILSPNLAAVNSLNAVANPYNLFSSDSFRPFDDSLLPNRLRGNGIYSFFLYNLNTGLIWVLFPLFIGAILFVITLFKCLSQYRKERLSSISNSLMGEYVFGGLFVMGAMIGAATVLQVRYGMKDLSNGMMSLVLCALVLTLLIIYSIIWIVKSPKFGQFYSQLEAESKIAVIYQFFYFLLGPFAGSIHYLFFHLKVSTLFVIAYASLLFLALCLKPIYQKVRDRVRVQINLLVLMIVQLPFLMAQMNPSYSYSSPTNMQLMLPIFVPIFLSINFLVNLSIFIYQCARKLSNFQIEKKDEKHNSAEEVAETLDNNEKVQMAQGTNLKTPLQTIIPKKYRDRFIEDDKGARQNDKNAEFKQQLNRFLEQEMVKVLNNSAEGENSGEEIGSKGKKFKKLRYTQPNYILCRQYDEIDQL